MRKLIMLFAIVALGIVTMPTHSVPVAAQGGTGFSPEEEALLKAVDRSLLVFNEVPGLAFSQVQILEQTISTPSDPSVVFDVVTRQEIVGTFSLTDAQDQNAEQLLTQDTTVTVTGVPPQMVTLVLEARLVDGVYYVRVVESSDDTQDYPESWVNWSENPNALPGTELFNFEQLLLIENFLAISQLANDAIISVTEAPETELDGVAVRQIVIEIDAVTFLTSDEANLAGILDPNALGADSTLFIETVFGGAVYQYVAYLDVETGFMLQTDIYLETDALLDAELAGGEAINLAQTVSTTITYTVLDEGPEIVAPALE